MSGTQQVAVGTELAPVTAHADLATSVLYAGASGDFNPLHYDPSFAAQVSPTGGVIAHGMYSMGLASRLLTAFAGGPEAVLEVSVRDRHGIRIRAERPFANLVHSPSAISVAILDTVCGRWRLLRGPVVVLDWCVDTRRC